MSEGTQSQYSSDAEIAMNEEVDVEMIDDEEKTIVETQIFTQHLPIIGKIPMTFYIPEIENQVELQRLVEKNGGKVIDQHECFTYQLKPENTKPQFANFYKGPIYSSKWIADSIEEGKCLNKDDYFICINIDERAKKLNIGKKKKYTIIEGIKLFDAVSNVKNLQINSSTFWTKVQNQSVLPERTADSMKSFWKKMQFKTLEQFLIESIYDNIDFCLSFKKIPNPDFLPRFRAKYEQEFLKMSALKDLNNDEMGEITEKERELERQFMLNSGGHIGRQQIQAPPQSIQNEKLIDHKVKESQVIQLDKSKEKDIKLDTQQIQQEQKREEEKVSYILQETEKLPIVEYDMEDVTYLTLNTRPQNTLESLVDSQLTKRMKKFVPTNFDLVDYDKELLKKQLDLETVSITLTRNLEKEKEYEVDQYYIRSVVRFENEYGKFQRLQQELVNISQDYGVPMEEIHQILEEVSCSKSKLIEVLKGQSFSKWNELEDLALQRGTEVAEYTYLLKVKGADEILRRKKFLGI